MGVWQEEDASRCAHRFWGASDGDSPLSGRMQHHAHGCPASGDPHRLPDKAAARGRAPARRAASPPVQASPCPSMRPPACTYLAPARPAELLRENKRMLDRAIRELDRERMGLQQQEKKLIMEIKKMAKEGQMVGGPG